MTGSLVPSFQAGNGIRRFACAKPIGLIWPYAEFYGFRNTPKGTPKC